MAESTETLSPVLPPDIERLAVRVLNRATDNHARIATAESCTGGLFASLLTDVEGCGRCFERGFVTYTDESKAELLGVPRDLLEREGAVSAAAAEAMVRGALARSRADVALAVTGYAGRGEPGDEPGLVYIAVARRDRPIEVNEYHFGDVGRGEVRLACLKAGLQSLANLF